MGCQLSAFGYRLLAVGFYGDNMLKNIQIWLPSYIAQAFQRNSVGKRPVHIIFSLVDHFEPRWGRVGVEKEIERVDTWLKKYPVVAQRHRDYDGNIPKHTFFYPIDEYTPEVFKKIVEFCKRGFGEIEVHLHHNDDTPQSLRDKLESAKKIYSDFGMLSKDSSTNEVRYGFIHGNWALCNSRRDGRWCGVNNELQILEETGCYADFTLPSAPSETQTQKINSIYYADGAAKPKSHNTGIDVKVGKAPLGGLMIMQGPLALNWKRRKLGIFPKIENSGISYNNPPASDRVDLWVNQKIAVKGKKDWIFVKVYTHGAQDENLKDEYFNDLDSMFGCMEERYNDGVNYKLHYVTARQMYNIIKAAEAGEDGTPEKYKDYLLKWNIA